MIKGGGVTGDDTFDVRKLKVGITSKCFEYITKCALECREISTLRVNRVNNMIDNLRFCEKFFSEKSDLKIEVEDHAAKNFFTNVLNISNDILTNNDEILVKCYEASEVQQFCRDLIVLCTLYVNKCEDNILSDLEMKYIYNSSPSDITTAQLQQKLVDRMVGKYVFSNNVEMSIDISKPFLKEFHRYVRGIYFVCRRSVSTYTKNFKDEVIIRVEMVNGIGMNMGLRVTLSN
ncbi:p27 [Malus domestica virus A]|uniref:p27 n=1 Tax=Malus domestica virus A TaxID=2664236 RepID=A0A5Q0TYP6_9CLOS|nr:p27 [Malus domestica virus A]QGA73182.1 p27 [Malus domestica virus A]